MKRRTMIGLAAVLTGSLVAGAGALAFGGHGGRQGFMKRVLAAAIDDALDEARATPQQRTAIHGVRDRVWAALEEHSRDRTARRDAILALFEGDRLDGGQLDPLRMQIEAEHRKVGDVIGAALIEVHDTLTPEQRHVVADYIRAHRWRAMH